MVFFWRIETTESLQLNGDTLQLNGEDLILNG